MTNIQMLIKDMCTWNRIVACDRTKLIAAREDELSEHTIDALQDTFKDSLKALWEIEVKAVKLGLLERLDAYAYITEEDLENAQ